MHFRTSTIAIIPVVWSAATIPILSSTITGVTALTLLTVVMLLPIWVVTLLPMGAVLFLVNMFRLIGGPFHILRQLHYRFWRSTGREFRCNVLILLGAEESEIIAGKRFIQFHPDTH